MIVLFTLIQENGRNRYGEIQTVLDMSIEEFMTQKYGSYWPVITLKGGLTTGAHLYASRYDAVWVEVPDLKYANNLIGRYAPVPIKN
ncbi:MAG TPA: hypothetical protein PKN88_09935 [Bacillota bacterium]|jgi:hypothetical protein|nr:hypothetical protein [Bacillota bacterium]HQA48347.1 hypothetical protein [Bacillota bacterium]